MVVMLDLTKLGYYYIVYPVVYTLITKFEDFILSCLVLFC